MLEISGMTQEGWARCLRGWRNPLNCATRLRPGSTIGWVFRNLRSGLRIGFADALTMDSDFCAPDGSDSLSHTSTVGSVVS